MIDAKVIDHIARLAHEANEAYCRSIGDPISTWDEASDGIRGSARDGVFAVLRGHVNSPGDAHRNWLSFKAVDGWSYGPVKDEAKKEHPCFLPFDVLPPAQQFKDVLFLTVVRGAARVAGISIPLASLSL